MDKSRVESLNTFLCFKAFQQEKRILLFLMSEFRGLSIQNQNLAQCQLDFLSSKEIYL